MEDIKVHHVGYLVKKLDKALLCFKELGYETATDIVRDSYRGIDICFMEKDDYRIELISPYSKESVVAGLLKKIGNSPYHICYQCHDIDKTITELRNMGGGMFNMRRSMKL